jgi:hypothetical protein
LRRSFSSIVTDSVLDSRTRAIDIFPLPGFVSR